MSAPKFLSFAFHVRYFPGVLLNRLRLGGRSGTGFPSTAEHHIVFAVCIILLALGVPAVFSGGSIIGWIAGGIGAAGTIALVINSVLACRGGSPSYDGFLAGVFFFFVFLGISCGVFIGTLRHSLLLGLSAGLAGFIGGYLLGIMAGYWLQYLGWISVTVNGLAGLAALGMFVVDLVLLSGVLL
ncbi:MAG: hypothetical protein A4E64_00292 [Syntrophorhabdus sp. PtaU1.Bin058]|nr:MAG: hypothetical protein A4E64_00292 [Syntrophorhabdus sp. PtaU1.Bin058]